MGFLNLDIATFLALLATIAFWVYQAIRSRQGRHVVCSQSEPAFSHLSLSQSSREWVRVEYVGDDQFEPVEIDTLGQIAIDIKNDSNTDALNDVLLEFRLPEARVVRVWWEKAPGYLLQDSRLSHRPEHRASTEADTPMAPPWTVSIWLPQLKSYRKYREGLTLGILADGDTGAIEMVSQGSKPGVTRDQVWTAKFVPRSVVMKRKELRRRLVQFLPLLGLVILSVLTGLLFPRLFSGALDPAGNGMFAEYLTITIGAVVILMLIALIIGLVIGVSMGRPNVKS
jgi:hypothetical protein